MTEQYWFRRKEIGWGWTPANWKGWLTLGIYTGLVISEILQTDFSSQDINGPSAHLIVKFLLLTGLLTVITVVTSRPRRT